MDTRSQGTSAVVMLQQHLTQISNEAASVCVTDYEDKADTEVESLVERAVAQIDSSLEALKVVDLLYGVDETEPTLDSWLDFDEEPVSSRDSTPSCPSIETEDIVSTVMMARMCLRRRERTLSALGIHSTKWDRLSAVGGAFRTILKSLGAVDTAMATAERMPPSINFHRRALERSLAIRRSYVRLHRAVVKGSPPSPDELYERMRCCGNAIAGTLGLPISAHLRIEDRALLMMAQVRAREWLSQKSDTPEHIKNGMRIWQDIANIATMFLEVSKREELVQHDARVVRETLRALSAPSGDSEAAVKARVIDDLSSIYGRSPALDALLDSPEVVEKMGELRAVLYDLDHTLRAATGDVDREEAPISGARSLRA